LPAAISRSAATIARLFLISAKGAEPFKSCFARRAVNMTRANRLSAFRNASSTVILAIFSQQPP